MPCMLCGQRFTTTPTEVIDNLDQAHTVETRLHNALRNVMDCPLGSANSVESVSYCTSSFLYQLSVNEVRVNSHTREASFIKLYIKKVHC